MASIITSIFRRILRVFINQPAGIDEQAAAAIVELARLPDELIYSILLKLPFKTLVRFLSKQWYSTMSVPSFSILHKKTTTTADDAAAACIVIYDSSSTYHRGWGYSFYARRITMRSSCNNEYYQFSKLGRLNAAVSSSTLSENYLCTSCNGLLCIASYLFSRDDDGRYSVAARILIRVWNPLTGEQTEIRELPYQCQMISTRPPLEHTNYSMVGLGYNHANDDFNIIFLLRDAGESKWLVQVMSLKTKTWRSVDPWPDLSRVDYAHYCSATANDVVYWIVSLKDVCDDDHLRILKCSLDQMKFEFISFPHGYQGVPFHDKIRYRIQCHKGSLYLAMPRSTLNLTDIWILHMLDDHVNAIWNKVDTIAYCCFLGFNSREQIIVTGLADRNDLHAYLPKEKKLVALDLSGYRIFGHLMQTETLACPY